MLKTKKGNVNVLMSIAMGIVVLALIVGIGLTVLTRIAGSQATCASIAGCGAAGVYNTSTDTCSNATSSSCATPTGSAYTSITYASTQLGQSGLLGWLPAIIALIVGVFFLFYFMGGRKKY